MKFEGIAREHASCAPANGGRASASSFLIPPSSNSLFPSPFFPGSPLSRFLPRYLSWSSASLTIADGSSVFRWIRNGTSFSPLGKYEARTPGRSPDFWQDRVSQKGFGGPKVCASVSVPRLNYTYFSGCTGRGQRYKSRAALQAFRYIEFGTEKYLAEMPGRGEEERHRVQYWELENFCSNEISCLILKSKRMLLGMRSLALLSVFLLFLSDIREIENRYFVMVKFV